MKILLSSHTATCNNVTIVLLLGANLGMCARRPPWRQRGGSRSAKLQARAPPTSSAVAHTRGTGHVASAIV